MRCMNTCASTDGARRAQNCAMFASVCIVVFMPLFAMCSSMFKLCVRMYAVCRSHLCIVNVREYEVQDTFPLQKNSFNRVPIGTEVYLLCLFERSSRQWTRGSENWVSAFSKFDHNQFSDSVPFSLWSFVVSKIPLCF